MDARRESEVAPMKNRTTVERKSERDLVVRERARIGLRHLLARVVEQGGEVTPHPLVLERGTGVRGVAALAGGGPELAALIGLRGRVDAVHRRARDGLRRGECSDADQREGETEAQGCSSKNAHGRWTVRRI